MNKNTLTIYAKLFSSLEGREASHTDDVFWGNVTLSNDTADQLNTLHNERLCSGVIDVYQNGALITSIEISQIEPKHYGLSCKVELSATHINSEYFICTNWDKLLKYPQYVQNSVKAVFFTDEGLLLTADSEDEKFKNYLKISQVCNLIDEVSLEPASPTSPRVIVFERDISIKYTVKQADLEHEISIKALDALMQKDLHHEAKTALVRQALVEFLKDISTSIRFGYLISHFNAFSSNLLLSYQGYVENYTFDKVRKEYQEKKTEYITRVNDVFSDVSTKLLSIPAGLWLAVYQIQDANLGGLTFYKNIITLCISGLLTVFVIFSLLGQFSVLNSLGTEYKGLFKRLKSEYEDESVQIEGALTDIKNSSFWVYLKLGTSILGSLLMFFIVLALMIYSL